MKVARARARLSSRRNSAHSEARIERTRNSSERVRASGPPATADTYAIALRKRIDTRSLLLFLFLFFYFLSFSRIGAATRTRASALPIKQPVKRVAHCPARLAVARTEESSRRSSGYFYRRGGDTLSPSVFRESTRGRAISVFSASAAVEPTSFVSKLPPRLVILDFHYPELLALHATLR